MYNNFFNSPNRNYNSNYNNQNRSSKNMSDNHHTDNFSDNNSGNMQNNSSGNLNLNNNERLKNIDPLKLKIIMEIRDKSKNKSIEELLPEIMKINQELNRRNMNFTKDETATLMDVIEESLSPADRQKFNMFKGFMA